MSESEGLNMEQSRERFANGVDVALAQSSRPFAIHNARKVDARGVADIIGWFPMVARLWRLGIGTMILLRPAQASVWMPMLIPIRSVRLVPAIP